MGFFANLHPTTILDWAISVFKAPKSADSATLKDWRFQLVNMMITLIVLIFVPFTFIFTLPDFIHTEKYILVGLDIALYLLALIHFLTRGKTILRHPTLWLIYIYIMSIMFHYDLGPLGARPVWLIMTASVAVLFYGLRAIWPVLILNISILYIFYYFFAPSLESWTYVLSLGTNWFNMFAVNLMGLTLTIVFPIGFMLKRLDQALERERNAQIQLSNDKNHLDEINKKLQTEINQREIEQQARLESEFQFQNLFNSSPGGIGMINLKGHIINVNSKMVQLFGYTRYEFETMNYTQLICPDFLFTLEMYRKQLLRGIPINGKLDIECMRKDRSTFPSNINGWLITDTDKKPKGIGFFLNDVSIEKELAKDKQELEKQLYQTQKMEAIGTLAGGIAHDFNNIIGGIYGYAELAKKMMELNRNKALEYMEQIIIAADRAKELVRQILRFSRQDNQEFFPLHLADSVKEVVTLLRSTFPSSIKIEIKIETQYDLIIADATQIHQVIMNLCTNAYHAMKPERGVLTINLYNQTITENTLIYDAWIDAGEYVCLSFCDTGKGIPPEIRNRIFEPYFTTKNKNEGTGLGLSVTQGIMKSHRGHINLISELGKGTTFYIYFPLSRQETEEKAKLTANKFHGNGQHICVIDDEIFLLDIFQQYLTEAGYKISVYNNPLTAYDYYCHHPDEFDLIITDLNMTEMTGLELAQAMKKNMPGAPPIILCTGFSDIINSSNYHEYGFSAMLWKPVNRRDILETIHPLL